MSTMKDVFKELVGKAITKDNIEYVLGTKKDGHRRAPYDVFTDIYLDNKKGKNKNGSKKRKRSNSYSIFLDTKKKKKNKKKNKYFRF